MDDSNNSESRKFNDILNNFDLVNHGPSPIHRSGHTFDLILTKTNCNILGTVKVDPVTIISDHMLITTTLDIGNIQKQEKNYYFP